MSVMWIVDSDEREGSAKLYDSADRLEQGIQYTNPSLLDITTGTAVTSGAGVTSIGTDGFGSDGAYHIDPADDLAKFNLGQIEHKPNIVLPNFPYTSGDGAVDYLSAYFKLDVEGTGGDAGKVYDNVSETWIGTVDTTTAEFTTVDSVNCLLTNDQDDALHIAVSTLGMASALGSIHLKVNVVSYDSTNTFIASGANVEFMLVRINDDLVFYYDGSLIFTATDASLTLIGKWVDIWLCWDYTNDRYFLSLNNKVLYSGAAVNTPAAQATLGTDLYIMDRSFLGGGRAVNGAVANFKLLDDFILPYGAYFTGNTAAQLAAGMYHKDILFYLDFEDGTTDLIAGKTATLGTSNGARTTGSALVGTYGFDVEASKTANSGIMYDVSSNDIVKVSGGSISMLADIKTFDLYCYLLSLFLDSDNYIGLSTGTHGIYLRLRYEQDGTRWEDSYTHGFSAGEIHHFRVTWTDLLATSTDVKLYVDGILQLEVTATSGTFNGTSFDTLFLGACQLSTAYSCDCYIDQVYITNNPNTPMIPTANGVPLDTPLIRND